MMRDPHDPVADERLTAPRGDEVAVGMNGEAPIDGDVAGLRVVVDDALSECFADQVVTSSLGHA
jgi:hypothetical protein